jgi:hypothetical protein
VNAEGGLPDRWCGSSNPPKCVSQWSSHALLELVGLLTAGGSPTQKIVAVMEWWIG